MEPEKFKLSSKIYLIKHIDECLTKTARKKETIISHIQKVTQTNIFED